MIERRLRENEYIIMRLKEGKFGGKYIGPRMKKLWMDRYLVKVEGLIF